jgi:GT2 family glycosyltransferase
MNKQFLVVIPHYGSDEYLKELLPTLGVTDLSDTIFEQKNSVIPFKYGEIFIWNNNLINVGFTRACNQGIRYAMNYGFDVVWFLNNDTKVVDLAKAVEDMEKEFSDHGATGVVGHKILSMDDPDFIHHGGTGACIPSGVHKVGRVSMGNLDERTQERWVTGASFAIVAGVALEIGVLDERMENYGSDSDYCYRARYAGFDVVYLPIPILHKIGQSANPSPEQVRVMKSDMLAFHSKWLTGKSFHDLDTEQMTQGGSDAT